MYQCTQCSHTYKDIDALRQHITTTHTGEEPHKCIVCPYTCASKWDWLEHIQHTHPDKQLHFCNKCNFSAAGKSDFRIHKRTAFCQMSVFDKQQYMERAIVRRNRYNNRR